MSSCSDDILAAGIIEAFIALGGDDDDNEEDACTMRCSKDSEKAVVQVSSRRNRAASKSRLHVWTFAFGDSDTRMLLLSSFATGAGKDDDAVVEAAPDGAVTVCGVSVPTLAAVTRSINAHICTGVAAMLREFVPVLPEWLPS